MMELCSALNRKVPALRLSSMAGRPNAKIVPLAQNLGICGARGIFLPGYFLSGY